MSILQILQGSFAIITSDKYDTVENSFASRLISPIYKPESPLFCFNFYYNIHGSTTDGFRILYQDYFDVDEKIPIRTFQGPLSEDRWYYGQVQMTDIPNAEYYIVNNIHFIMYIYKLYTILLNKNI